MGRGRVESDLPMKTKTYFAVRIDVWDATGDNLVARLAGLDAGSGNYDGRFPDTRQFADLRLARFVPWNSIDASRGMIPLDHLSPFLGLY
jgi:hypothetical protein